MSQGRMIESSIGQLLVALSVLAGGCDTASVGVEACQDIEAARCEAAQYCGLVKDVEACIRFSRDHCLHGVALQEAPGSVEVKNCVKAIRAAGKCADKDRHAAPADCSSETIQDSDATEICDVVEEPERATDCAFLVPEDNQPQPEPQPDSKGDAG